MDKNSKSQKSQKSLSPYKRKNNFEGGKETSLKDFIETIIELEAKFSQDDSSQNEEENLHNSIGKIMKKDFSQNNLTPSPLNVIISKKVSDLRGDKKIVLSKSPTLRQNKLSI